MMRPWWAALAAALMFWATSAWADVRIVGETVVPEHRLVRLEASGADPDAALIWEISDEDKADVEEFGTRFRFTGPPGVYKVKLRAIRFKDGKSSVETARTTVTIGEGNPDPAPPPGPKPDPTPGPKPPPAKAWVIVIEETGDGMAERGRFFADPDLRKYILAKGWKHRVADKDVKDRDGNTPSDLKPYIDATKGKSLPHLFVVDQDGGERFNGPLPATPAELLAVLKQIGG